MRSSNFSPQIASLASAALTAELRAFPKPGLVSFEDNGSHPDMNADCFVHSIETLEPYFEKLAEAGAERASFQTLQAIGLEAEAAMLDATGGRNTHRGAIFSLGLLVAAAGLRAAEQSADSLGSIVRERWGHQIPLPENAGGDSHGLRIFREHGLGGAREEAVAGFPSVYEVGLPAFQEALERVGPNAACIHTHFHLLARCADTTLIKRGGLAGLDFARNAAAEFLAEGGVFRPDWRNRALRIHRDFVSRGLTAGGVADLLAATWFVDHVETSFFRS